MGEDWGLRAAVAQARALYGRVVSDQLSWVMSQDWDWGRGTFGLFFPFFRVPQVLPAPPPPGLGVGRTPPSPPGFKRSLLPNRLSLLGWGKIGVWGGALVPAEPEGWGDVFPSTPLSLSSE